MPRTRERTIDERIREEVIRNNALKARLKPKFDIDEYCFDKQIAFIKDAAPFKTAVCSRRAGKTVACAAHLIKASQEKANTVSIYITLSRSNAKKIVWPELCNINRKFNLEGKVNETELSITFPNRSVIYASGAKDQKEIEKFRGLPIYLCYIDESQAFPHYLQRLVDEVISKALFDYNGTLCLTGTPGPIPSGFFFECAHSPKWSRHSWTMFDNPWLPRKSGKTAKELLQRELDRKGVDVTNPTIQRECFGKWSTDTSVLVIKYDAIKNHFENVPEIAKPWRYILGVDIGYEDADAIAVVGWNEALKGAYLVEEKVTTKQGISELANSLIEFCDKYKPDNIVMDTGGLGKKVAEEITRRYAIMISPAEKTRKLEFIELMNDALRTQRFYAKKDSHFAQDAALLQWETDTEAVEDRGDKPKIKYQNEKRVISDTFHSDAIDAALYAYREALHWLWEPEKPKIQPHTNEYYVKIEKDLEEAAVENLKNVKEDDPWATGVSTWDLD